MLSREAGRGRDVLLAPAGWRVLCCILLVGPVVPVTRVGGLGAGRSGFLLVGGLGEAGMGGVAELRGISLGGGYRGWLGWGYVGRWGLSVMFPGVWMACAGVWAGLRS